jgi:hypothetical protein
MRWGLNWQWLPEGGEACFKNIEARFSLHPGIKPSTKLDLCAGDSGVEEPSPAFLSTA